MGPWIDSHSHLCSPRYQSADRSLMLERAVQAGGRYFVQGGIDPRDWKEQRELARRYPGLIGIGLGLHPEWVRSAPEEALEAGLHDFRREVREANDITVWGELGLHFAVAGPPAEMPSSRHEVERQERVFRECLLAIRQAGRTEPIVLHGVRAQARMLAIWDSVFEAPRAGMVHSYSGSFEGALEWIRRGLLISPSPGVARAGFETLKKTVARLPLESLALESDCPDQSPARASTPDILGAPTDVLEVAQAVAVLRGLPAEEGGATLLKAACQNLARIGISVPPSAMP